MLSDGGTDWKTIHVRDTSKKSDLTDIIKGIKFSNIAWLPDESGFFYSRYPQNEAGKYDDSQTVSIYFHAIGTAQSEDKKVLRLTINLHGTLILRLFKMAKHCSFLCSRDIRRMVFMLNRW